MLRNFNKKVITLTIPCLSFSAFSATTNIIYGLNNAIHYTSHSSKPIFIQANSFTNIANARHYQQQLSKMTTYPVTIITKNTYHRVMIGPLPNDKITQHVAIDLLHHKPSKPSAIAITQPITIPTKVIPQKPVAPLPTASARAPQWFISAGVGEQYPQINGSTGVNNGSGLSAPYNQDLYTLALDAQPVVTAGIGRRWERDHFFIPSYSLGVFYQYFSQSTVHGSVMQYSLPAYTNYNYSWNVSSNMVLASGKLNLFRYARILPYINGGIGTAFTHASQYNELALAGVTPRTSPGFTDNNNQQFAYNGGAGIDIQINPQALVSVGYLYQNLGNVNLGQGTGSWSSQNLALGTYQSNEVLVSVSYLLEK